MNWDADPESGRTAASDVIETVVVPRARDLGSVLRLLQSGSIRSYAAWVLFGSVLLMVAMGIAGGLR